MTSASLSGVNLTSASATCRGSSGSLGHLQLDSHFGVISTIQFLKLFSDAIEYPSLSCTESHLLYWNIFILLYPLIDQLLVFLGHPRGHKSFILWDIPLFNLTNFYATWSANLPEVLTSVTEHYADLIFRSAKFLVQPKAKGTGVQTLLAPFSQATQFYRTIGATEKHRWSQAVFMHLPKLGFGIAPFLKDIVWPK